MPGPLIILKAFQLKRATKRLMLAKENALRIHKGERPRYPWYEETFNWTVECVKNNFCAAFCPCCVRSKKAKQDGEYSEDFLRNPCLEGTFENFTLKSLLGFFSGIALSIMIFFFLINQLNMNPIFTTIICSLVAGFLSIGLAFSEEVRCLMMLSLPVMFSNRGRMALMAYTYILVMSGPTKNAMRNANILVETMNCGQEIIIKQTKAILKSIFAPLVAIVDVMREILRALKDFARQMKEAFIAIRDLFLEIINAIKSIFRWLLSIVNVCSSKYGSPYERCNKAFDDAIADCEKKLGLFKFLCYIVHAVKYICEVARNIDLDIWRTDETHSDNWSFTVVINCVCFTDMLSIVFYENLVVDLLCMIPKAIKTGIIEPMKEQVKNFARHMYNQFYVNITFVHYYNYSLEQSKSFADIRGDIADEIRDRTEWFLELIDWSDFFMCFFFFFVGFNAYVYRLRYLSADHFDNIYISFQVRDIDDRRAMQKKETILPLSFRERRKYVNTFSLRMARSERRQLMIAGTLLFISGLQMSFYMVLDYSLYHFLKMIRYYGRIEAKGQIPTVMQIQVKGGGVMADMYREMVTQFDPLMKSTPEFDTAECLPNPVPIDLDRYQKIGILYAICIILAVTESYGLRLRHVICGCYYPQREKFRAVWLYNRILKTRGSITKFLRRRIRQKVQGDDTLEKISLMDRLTYQFPLFGRVAKAFGFIKINCLSCNEPGDPEDYVNFKRCSSPGCKGIYCYSCFEEMKNVCTLCMNPLEYGDLSDVSEERDSSEEDLEESVDEEVTDTDSETVSDELDMNYQYQESSIGPIPQEELRQPFRDVEAEAVEKDLASVYDLRDSDDENLIS